jgi:hypothetical protein
MSVDEGDVGRADDPAVVDWAETVAERVGLTLGAGALPSPAREVCDVPATSAAGSEIATATLQSLTCASMAS